MTPRAARARVLAVHGFGLGPAAFADVAALLPDELLALEVPGHGTLEPSSFDDAVALIVGAIRTQARPPIVWGYSLGARLALAAVRTLSVVVERSAVAGLVLESGTAGIRDAGERSARRALDAARADDLELRGIDAFFREWDAQPMFASMALHPEAVDKRRALRARHDPVRLAAALRAFSPGERSSMHEALPQITVPTLLLVGALDERYTSEARAMAALLPSSEVVVLAGCGHAPHLEDPRATASAVASFIKRFDKEETT